MATKKDSGIIPELNITEEVRDKLNKIDWSKPRRDPNDNPENWTTKECETNNYSGLRHNTFTAQMELWIAGKIIGQFKASEAALYPERFAEFLEAKLGCAVILTMDIKDAVGVAESQAKQRALEGKKPS